MLPDKFPGSLLSTNINFSQEQYGTLTKKKNCCASSEPGVRTAVLVQFTATQSTGMMSLLLLASHGGN